MKKLIFVLILICLLFNTIVCYDNQVFSKKATISNNNAILNDKEDEKIVENNLENDTKNNLEDDIKNNYAFYLKKLGYFNSNDGDYNLSLRNAILRFQANENMDVDGDFGPQSLKKLIDRISLNKTTYNDIISDFYFEEKWIVVNKSKRILTLYEGKEVLKKYPVAIGAISTSTPSGHFEIINKQINPYWNGGGYTNPIKGGDLNNPLGKRWLGLSIPGNGYGIHGNINPYSIGSYASHGCIRMINSDVHGLYENVNIGIKVIIGNENEINKLGIFQN